jgi:hypothetical protein
MVVGGPLLAENLAFIINLAMQVRPQIKELFLKLLLKSI